ncbi:hypothetical protein LZ31DRAFT_555541 [Colletotrichum somersetense]|nr:hypothetical protein LZ31DRAFT_555541 [Colletotrichum somersetense]
MERELPEPYGRHSFVHVKVHVEKVSWVIWHKTADGLRVSSFLLPSAHEAGATRPLQKPTLFSGETVRQFRFLLTPLHPPEHTR